MAKDPAFSFYTNDFDSKTKFFTHEQVGMYLRLLMAQHQHGHLTEQQMMHICGRYDNDVFGKFSKDEAGNFFNDRLESEVEKRRAYSASRRNNRKGTNNTSSTHDNHMSPHMDIDIDNDNCIVFGSKGELRISVKKVYAGDKIKVIYDLREYFKPQLDQFSRSGWTKFIDFMRDNPGRVFDDDNHVYNAFKQFHLNGKKEVKNRGKIQ